MPLFVVAVVAVVVWHVVITEKSNGDGGEEKLQSPNLARVGVIM